MLLAALFALSTSELRLELVRESLTGTHCRYRQYTAGVAADDYTIAPCPAGALPVPSASHGALRMLQGRVARRVVVEEEPLRPFAYDYDAATGLLLRRVPLFFNARPARVFDPNPVASLNDPSLQDQNDSAAAVPQSAYRNVDLDDQALHGPWVTIVDRQPRNVPPAEGELTFDRAADGFEDVSAWFHIDRNQRYLQSLGYTGTRGVAAYPIEVDAHAANGGDTSYFIPSLTQPGRGTLYFGEGGTDDAEDADLLVHEYMHAIIEWIAPETFGGAFASESRALSEGMADYWAYSEHVEARVASGRDPFCFADWDARCWLDDASEQCAYAPGSDCLRRLDSTRTMADYENTASAGVEHRNGAIWSSALREIRSAIGRTAADTILIESLFDTPARPTFAVMAHRLLDADRLLYQGTYSGAICKAMYDRGVLTQCDLTARGERTIFQATDFGIPIPDTDATGIASSIVVNDARAIERVFVRVDIDHSAAGDLRVELTAPDGTKFVLHQISSSRAADIHETYGLTAVPVDALDVLRGRSAAGRWTLSVVDLQPRDAGVLRSWALEIQFAGDAPTTDRPRAEHTQTIPVVAHAYGIDGAWTSDLRVSNSASAPVKATLVFTPSGEDGESHFIGVQVSVGPGHTVAFDDVVRTLFHTAGTGALEVLGDVSVTSRTNVETPAGSLSQQVPVAAPRSRAMQGSAALIVAPWTSAGRCNLGIVAIGAGTGLVRIRNGATVRELILLPHTHLQLPVDPLPTEVSVVSGSIEIAAYLSQIDAASGDAMFIPAQSAAAEAIGIAPAITTDGGGWQTDFWASSVAPSQLRLQAIPGGELAIAVPASYLDVLKTLFHLPSALVALHVSRPSGVFAATRIQHGATTEFVPFLEETESRAGILFIESSDARRTNVGIVSSGSAVAEVIVYDAAGTELERRTLSTPGGVAQASVASPVVNGRAEVRFTSGRGRGYASVIDLRSGDATFFAAE